MENNNVTFVPGMRVTFASPRLPAVGVMAGVLEGSPGDMVFIPDEEHADALYVKYGVEAEEGLYLEGCTVLPL